MTEQTMTKIMYWSERDKKLNGSQPGRKKTQLNKTLAQFYHHATCSSSRGAPVPQCIAAPCMSKDTWCKEQIMCPITSQEAAIHQAPLL